jgi:hypothetical protein
MARFMMVFGAHAMDHIPEQDLPDVAEAARAVCKEAIDAGVYFLAAGLEDQRASIVAVDGTVTDGTYPDTIGGITIVDVPSRQEALKWASKFAAACRCSQEVRQLGFDPELEAMLREPGTRRRRPDEV